MTLRIRVAELLADGNGLEAITEILRGEYPKLKPHRVREAYNILVKGGIPRDKRSIENDSVPRNVGSIWSSLRSREAALQTELKRQVTLPKLKFMEKEWIDD
jgi:hypothetical protein